MPRGLIFSTRSGITTWYARSFETRLSDLKKPSGSDSSSVRLQNSRSVSLLGKSPAARNSGVDDRAAILNRTARHAQSNCRRIDAAEADGRDGPAFMSERRVLR